MKLLTKEILAAFKRQGDTSEKKAEDIMVIAKFFYPAGAATWFACEYDGIDIFFGYVTLGDPDNAELGSFSLMELEEVRGKFGLGIERDLHWSPKTLREVMDAKGVM